MTLSLIRCQHALENWKYLGALCNNPEFLRPFSTIYWKFSGKCFFYTGSPKISADSSLYWEVPSYRQNHITLPILFHFPIQSS